MKYAILPLLLLAGCAGKTVEPVIQIKEVIKPVAVACVPSTLTAKPSYPDTDAALIGAADAAERYQLVAAGRELRKARLNELETVVEGCKVK